MTGQKPKTPEQARQFLPGPAIHPTKPLLDWLQKVGKERVRVRIPVIIRLDQHRLGIAKAFIGTVDSVDDQTIFLRLDDSPMGISLFDHVRPRCSKSETACAVWLEGYWDAALSAGIPMPYPFTAVRFHEFIEGTTGEEKVRAQREAPSS